MNDILKRCLEDLEARLIPETEEELLREWIDFTEGRFIGNVFTPERGIRSQPQVEWPVVRTNETLDCMDKMALQQYGVCSKRLEEGNGAPLAVRSNYGTSIIPLLFGVEPFVMPEETDTLPTSVPLHDTAAIERLIKAGMPDLQAGFGARVFEAGRLYVEIGKTYPKIGKYVKIFHPDQQGPLDICEVIWGSDIFLAIYDAPQLVKALLELVTDTYIAFMREWTKITPFDAIGNVHWDVFHGGSIMLRNDSSMNISPAQYDEFARPYDEKLLMECGGGAVHFCGRGDHYISSMCGIAGLRAVNLSQPEYNDMEVIFTNAVDRGINILDLDRKAVESALESGRDLRGRVHCREKLATG